MIRKLLTQLCIWILLVGVFSCHHQEELRPVSQSTDLIAQITEPSFSSRYKYDQQGRLIGQLVDASINSGDYGPNTSHVEYTFIYTPAELIMTYTGTRNGQSLQGEQHISLNKQGLVAYSPRFICTDVWRAPGADICRLLKGAMNPLGPEDTLRQYDTDGYLVQVERTRKSPNPILPNYSEFSRVNQTVSDGNITQVEVLAETTDPDSYFKPTPWIRQFRYTYDKTKPGIRNPYQFMGNTNLNLVQTEQEIYNQSPVLGYKYGYDKKGRVESYTISNSTGHLTYVNP